MEVYEQEYLVHTYEVDPAGRLRPVALLSFLQDAAGVHAERHGVSVTGLHRLGLKWLLTRYRVAIDRHAELGDRLTVRTWPSSREGLQITREFRVLDGSGAPVAAAVTGWMVLDLETQRPVRAAERLPEFAVHGESALEGGFPALGRLRRADVELPFRVRLADLDLNRHVNNVVYVEWALETAPEDVLAGWAPSVIEVAYRAEAFHPGRVISRTEVLEGGECPRLLHQLVSEADGRELARLRTTWAQKTP